ncbi:hypothetical protein [Aurantiacibacter sediminis]|uniref:Autotransporter outer membrane beta-barrel domain-containing protein n=1 Tax=Aurantiacibacter sediminis TaxID=2793064 RepID=A0ABS0N6K3_9SPHN|nr:hypothetical protein [Aurantiacibacter sediminis]MBH5323391.1 hypothetical protein [Aurantiacibacter sediminis]
MSSNAAPAYRPRGKAIFAFVGLLAAWASVRVITWAPPFDPASLNVIADAPSLGIVAPMPDEPDSSERDDDAPEQLPGRIMPPQPRWVPQPVPERIPPPHQPQPRALQSVGHSTGAMRGFAGAGRLVGHILLLQAGYRNSAAAPVAASSLFADSSLTLRGAQSATDSTASATMRGGGDLRRWSLDAWALWRDDTTTPILSGRPSYGRGQAGAVIRYHLAPSSGHNPQLHLRGVHALEGQREREAAFGASARPIPAIPVRLAAEARVSETDRGTELRGAAYAVSEFPPVNLPAGLTGEAYIQGGYVTGDFATGFVDGQARITRRVVGTEDFRLEAGAGAWGGVQEGSGRLDIGPSASVSFRLGDARGRVSADYRLRVAGEAEPSSGPALTLSAGF